MTTLREVAQQFVADYDCGGCGHGCGHFSFYADEFRKTLAQQEQEQEQKQEHQPGCALLQIPSRDCDCRPEQKPVAWMFQHKDTGRKNYVSNDGCNGPGRFLVMNPRYALVGDLYTHPPRREWQSLSEEEISRIEDQCWSHGGLRADFLRVDFARAIEAKLKEKNNG